MDKNKTSNFTLVAKTSGTAFVERETYQTNTKQRAFGNENRTETQREQLMCRKVNEPSHPTPPQKQNNKENYNCSVKLHSKVLRWMRAWGMAGGRRQDRRSTQTRRSTERTRTEQADVEEGTHPHAAPVTPKGRRLLPVPSTPGRAHCSESWAIFYIWQSHCDTKMSMKRIHSLITLSTEIYFYMSKKGSQFRSEKIKQPGN